MVVVIDEELASFSGFFFLSEVFLVIWSKLTQNLPLGSFFVGSCVVGSISLGVVRIVVSSRGGVTISVAVLRSKLAQHNQLLS